MSYNPEMKISTQVNIWSILATVCFTVVTLATLSAVTAALSKTIDDHETRLRALETKVLTTMERMDARLVVIEREVKRD